MTLIIEKAKRWTVKSDKTAADVSCSSHFHPSPVISRRQMQLHPVLRVWKCSRVEYNSRYAMVISTLGFTHPHRPVGAFSIPTHIHRLVFSCKKLTKLKKGYMLDEKFSNFVFYLCTTNTNAALQRRWTNGETQMNEWTIVWRKKLTVSDI